jgi:hypothetical protein
LTVIPPEAPTMPASIVPFNRRRSTIGVMLAVLNLAAIFLTAIFWPSSRGGVLSMHSTAYEFLSDGSSVAVPEFPPWTPPQVRAQRRPTLVRPPSLARLRFLWAPTVAVSGVSLLTLVMTREGARPVRRYRFTVRSLVVCVAFSALALGWFVLVIRPPKEHPYATLWFIRGSVPLAALLVSSLCIRAIVAHDTPGRDRGVTAP